MTALRRLLAHRRWLAAWLVAATLAVRVLVPGGYMPARPGSLTLMICSGGMAPASMTTTVPGLPHGDEHGGDHGKMEQPCPFAGLAMPSLADAGQPMALAHPTMPLASFAGALADARAPPRRGHLRPPLRGPPSLG